MKDGYYYFIPASAGKTEIDKSLGYLCVTKYPNRASYSIQCSLSREPASNYSGKTMLELYLSPVTYITAQSLLIGKMLLSPQARLFLDATLPATTAEGAEEDQYVIVTAGGRTLYYSLLYKKPQAEPQTPQMPQAPATRIPFPGQEFDPFDTTNPAYRWYIYDNRTDSPDSVRNIQELDKLFRYFNVRYDIFAKMNSGSATPYSDTFLKMSFYSVQVAGHVLRGAYKDPENGRAFTVIGLPGWNAQQAIAQNGRRTGTRRDHARRQSTSSGTARTIRECARWLTAKRKPPCGYNRNYNGYWLYYFDTESGLPVKAVLKEEE